MKNQIIELWFKMYKIEYCTQISIFNLTVVLSLILENFK